MSQKNNKYYHQENSLSSFFTGAAVGAVAALLLGTQRGREVSRELYKEAKKLAKDLDPNLKEVFSENRHQEVEKPKKTVLNKLKRNNSNSNLSSFTKNGQPLRN